MAQNPFSAVVRVAGFRDFGKFLRHEIDGVFSFASVCRFPVAERDGRLLSAPLPVVQFVSLPCRRRLPGKCDIGTVCSLPAACFVSSSASRACPAETGFGFFLPGCHLLFPLLPSAALSYCVFFLCRLLMSLTGISDCIHLQ